MSINSLTVLSLSLRANLLLGLRLYLQLLVQQTFVWGAAQLLGFRGVSLRFPKSGSGEIAQPPSQSNSLKFVVQSNLFKFNTIKLIKNSGQ